MVDASAFRHTKLTLEVRPPSTDIFNCSEHTNRRLQMAYNIHEMSNRASNVIEAVRAIGPTLRERAVEANARGRLSDETVRDLHEAGVYNIGLPAEYGGYELPVAEQLEIIIEVAKWDGSCGWSSWVGATTNWIAVRSGKRVVEEVFGIPWVGPRVSGSSHFPATQGRAKKVEGGWMISGGPWTFGSNALWTPYSNLGCKADKGQGTFLVGAQVPRDEIRFLDDWKVAGMRGSGSNSMALVKDELFVPDYRCTDFRNVVAGAIDHGLKGALWHASNAGMAFSLMGGMSIGLAYGVLQRFLERSAGRPIRGTTYTNQLEAPMTQIMLSEVHSKIQSAALMARANAAQVDRYSLLTKAGEPIDPKEMRDFDMRVMLETAYAAKWCAEAIELLQRNSGSTAIMESEFIQRAWRDARVVTLHGALNLEGLQESYGRLMAGFDPLKVGGMGTQDRFAPSRGENVH